MDDPTKASIDLVEAKIASERVFDGNLLHVRRDTVRLPNARTATREYIVHPGAVAILAMLANGEIVLERQFRYPLDRVLIEIPAGKIDAGEDPLTTGKRELREETGYVASHWEHLITYYPLVAYSDERIDIYLATGLARERANLDDGEFLEVFTAPLATAAQWVREGRIVDSKSIISILLMAERLKC